MLWLREKFVLNLFLVSVFDPSLSPWFFRPIFRLQKVDLDMGKYGTVCA